jgi:carboxypeptidase Q
VDIEPLYHKGVPMINNMVEDTPDLDFYYKYHHTAGDSMTMIDPDNLDSNVVGIAALLYILADL